MEDEKVSKWFFQVIIEHVNIQFRANDKFS
jgi:hypothetical protein